MPVVEASRPDGGRAGPCLRDPAESPHGDPARQVATELPPARRGQRLPIDIFFRSLADDCGERAAGIVLSGTGSDGTLGLARSPPPAACAWCRTRPARSTSACRPAPWPASPAAQSLTPARMPEALLRHASAGSAGGRRPPAEPQPVTDVAGMNRVLMLLRSATGHDYALYKSSTLGRRMQRRMAAHGIDDVASLCTAAGTGPGRAAHRLDKEMLINVTSFFRDPEAFAALSPTCCPSCWPTGPTARPPGLGRRVRLGRGGLQHGDAAARGHGPGRPRLQAAALRHRSRRGSHRRRACRPVPAAHRRAGVGRAAGRFFVEEEGGFRIRKSVRDQIVFAVQNVIKDPPFTRLDLLSCRNLLIYLEPALQDRLLPVLHYALTPGAVLMLSPSESVGQHADLFAPIDRKHKLYRALLVSTASRAARRYACDLGHAPRRTGGDRRSAAIEEDPSSLAELARTALLHSFAPASVLIDAEGTVLYVHGDTGAWLRPAPGEASLNIVEMAREGLEAPLRAAILGAAATGLGTLNRELSVQAAGLARTLLLSVRPLEPQPAGAAGSPALLLVSFRDVAARGGSAKAAPWQQARRPAADPLRLEALQEELKMARATLHRWSRSTRPTAKS